MKTSHFVVLSVVLPLFFMGYPTTLWRSHQSEAAGLSWSSEEIGKANTGNSLGYLTGNEQATLMYINLARLYPRRFAEVHLKPYRRLFDGKFVKRADAVDVLTLEGAPAVTECIAEMSSRRPVRALIPSAGLSRAARDHAGDQGPRGETGHRGWERSCGECISYGPDDPLDIVIQLLVDDAVPERGHRRNLLDGSFARVGLAGGQHEEFGHMCVIDLAGAYMEMD